MNATDVKIALRNAHPAPEWAIMFEVADATGAVHSRLADAIAMNMWPSRGLAIVGYEVKVYRNDWLREIKKPQKAEAISSFCDHWNLITPPSIAKPEEIPEPWGWIEVQENGRLKTIKQAPKLDAKPPTREFVASMLRSAGKTDEKEIKARIDTERERIQAQFEDQVERRVKRLAGRTKEMDAIDAAVRDITGDDKWYTDERLLLAVKAVYKSDIVNPYGNLQSLRFALKQTMTNLDEGLAAFGINCESAKKAPARRRKA